MERRIKYLMTTEQDLSWGLVTSTVGHQDIAAGAPYPSHKHPVHYLFSDKQGRILNEYQLVYITRGKGAFTSAHQSQTEIHAGDLFLLFPNEWHTYHPDVNEGWYEYWIGFTGHEMDAKVGANFFSRESPVVKIGFDSDIVHLFQSAVQTAKEQQPGYQQVLAGIINLLLGLTYSKARLSVFDGATGLLEKINRAKVLIHENDRVDFSGEQIARAIGLSYSTFRRFFKQYTGFAPKQYFQELRIGKSKELLANSSLTCQEIAFEMGFETPSYFNTIFRKKTGMTPNEYRNTTRGRHLI